MTDILFTANGASATVLVSSELTSGMVGVPVRFAFDSNWDGLNIVVVFDGGGKRISVPLLTDMEAVLPWEVIAKANTRLRIGAEGRKSDGSVVVPTVWANAGYIAEGAAATDDEGNPPTPSIYDQIMAAIEAGKLQGKPGEDGVSPTVSVTEIEGGHRVTITDANGTSIFDVMDGEDAKIVIADDLDTRDPSIALSANMGNVLKEKIDTDILTVEKSLEADIEQRVKTVNGIAPDEDGNVNVDGVSAEEKELILSLLRNAAYTADMSETFAQLSKLWGIEVPDEPIVPDEPVVTTYNVTNNLTGVTNSNAQTEVTEGFYSATLSAEDGYTITAIITMGGVDITNDVFTAETGSILITEVTGDIVITATAELATAPVLYQLANTPRTVNADLFEDTGLTFGNTTANGYTKAWTMVAKVSNMTAGKLWCVAGNAGLCSHYENRWNNDVGNKAAHLTTYICSTVTRPAITSANPNGISIVITKEAMAEKTATVHYLSYAGELTSEELVGINGKFNSSTYLGNMMVGGQAAADFVGTIEEFTIYEGVATEDQIKSYLGVA